MAVDEVDLIIGMELVPRAGRTAPANVSLAVALARAGALPVVELTEEDLASGLADLHKIASRTNGALAIQPATAGLAGSRHRLPLTVSTVVIGASLTAELLHRGEAEVRREVGSWAGLRVIAEVTDADSAGAAVASGADGLIAKGSESGGRVGSTETFILLQQAVGLGVPVWARGGIGLHTAAGAVALGARGVVIDGQLALVKESNLPAATRRAIAAMDGSETRVVAGHRVYTRPDLPAASRPEPHRDQPDLQLGPDITRDLLPVGQDGAVAARLAGRFRTAGGVVAALSEAVAANIAAAAASEPLRPGGGVAEAHDLRYPIAQGPMTRVSDRAAFAAAVADGGGLPFLALALLRGHEVEPLLEETGRLLEGRAWGVGILGFVPPELREEQLQAVRRARPPVALIAGGRPSQAAPLEEAGIATYLHVPSPGLLDMFVKDGARRFVFEGRECGGHVGPQASFPLWEAQVERLLAVPDPENLHILFAGGIHDARSAAAVAAIGAKLAAKGAHLGVLMGTAYLFTQEAVECGAITRGFQQQAVDCRRTVLLETSPGHATRCAETDYVRTFAGARARLEGEGVTTKQMWAELETLNLGRLRIASKGLDHGEAGLESVDEETQRREGMYMLGQVATLRRELTTVAELHAGVSAGGTEALSRLAAELAVDGGDGRGDPAGRVPEPLDVAIVGMASMFPGSVSAEEFWATIVAGVNSITEVPRSRFDSELYFDPEATTSGAGRKTPSKWGGFLRGAGFDPLAYGIPPASLASIEPVQLLSLEVAARALADAGYSDRDFDRSRTAVIFGAENGNDLSGAYGLRAVLPQLLRRPDGTAEIPEELDEYLPELTEDSFPGVLTNVIAGRIANRLDLGGMNFTVDAACAASLAAIDAACKELVAGNSDMVLCGAADVHNGLNDFLLFSSVHALSPTGQCRTFDSGADGIALGEGVACVVLKRRDDAERDGNRIYAVIEAVAGSSDGRHLGLTAPRKEGQQAALERAYAQARISPADLGLVEAHGTGTVVGDRTELNSLTGLWSRRGAEPGSCTLGSVKSQIGHTKCAAGLAGLIKVAGALYRGVLPPTNNIVSPNAAYDAEKSPFRFLDRALPWASEERRAGVSAFGFGGSNFHAVLSAYGGDDGPAHGVDLWPAELFLFRGATMQEALARVAELQRAAEAIAESDPAGERHRLRDLAATAAGWGSGRVQVALVAGGFRELADRLAAAGRGEERRDGVFLAPAGERATTAFLYPGQGSQRAGMLAELFVTFPHLRDLLRKGDRWLDALYPAAAFTAEERAAQQARITDTRVAQPVLGICGLAMTRLLETVGVAPDVAAGHSYGELVALAAAGVFDAETLLELSAARGHAIVNAAGAAGGDPGTMAAVSGSAEGVEKLLERHPDVVIANHNGPSQVVISGGTQAVAAAVEDMQANGMAARAIKVACAFHSPIVSRASADLALELASVGVASPVVPVFSNTNGGLYPESPAEIRELVAEQLARPVLFVDEVEAMYAAGVRHFVEVGPGRVLTQLVGKILGDRPHRAIATDVAGEHGVTRFLLALAELAVLGHDVRTEVLFDGRAAEVDLAALPLRAPGWRIDGHLVRLASGEVVAGSLRPADEFPVLRLGAGTAAPAATGSATGSAPGGVAATGPAPAAPAGSEREAVVLEYLRGLREIVAAEREVMLRYLGAAPACASLVATLPEPGPAAAPAMPVMAAAAPPAPAEMSAPAAAGRVRGEALVAVVLRVVAERTGYPTDMLDLDLDLEADLSIDSIKRIEIIGELAERIGLRAGDESLDDSALEALAQLKSLREIAAWIDELEGADAPAAAAPAEPAGPAEQPSAADPALAVPPAAVRHVMSIVPIGLARSERGHLGGRRILLVDDGRGVAAGLAADLSRWGAEVAVTAAAGRPGEADLARLAAADALIWLRGLHPDAAADPVSFDARSAFAWWQPALLGSARKLLVATAGSGWFAANPSGAAGLGLAGMAKSISKEMTGTEVRVVDLDPHADPDFLAACLSDEFFDIERSPVEVGYDGLQRVTRVAVPEPVSVRTLAGDETRGPLHPQGGGRAVVLLTGGARGITARAALAIAGRTAATGGCVIELLGRSPLPEDAEDPSTAGAVDLPSLRKALIASGRLSSPAAIEAECTRLMAAREIRSTMAALAGLGCETAYHQIDVRDAESLAALVSDMYQRHGRIDLVVHGAGVLDDRLLKDKTAEGYERVFATKVDAARTLLAATGPETATVLFGSVSGVFGNRGQVDYSAANDALDDLAESADGIRPGRVVSIDWGPWAGTGMVSPELEREYARRGIGLIDPDDGVKALLAELAALPTGAAHVVVMRATVESMDPGSAELAQHARAAHR